MILSSRANAAFLAVASLVSSGADALSQSDTLLRFYNQANGDHWKNNDGWKEAAEAALATGGQTTSVSDVCTWHGISCDENKAIQSIDLSYNNVANKVSQHIWALPALRSIDLQGNLIKDAGLLGFAAGFSTRAPVEFLDISENRLTTVEGIGSAPTSLRELHMGSNAFEGRFPEEVYRLTKLKILRASYNAGFVGTISSEIGNMVNLRELSISFTNIHGDIPKEIGNLSLLEFLSLDNNRFKGSLPEELEHLHNLKYLSITNTESEHGALTGELLSFKKNKNLKELYLNDNAIVGSIPSDLLADSLLTDKAVMVSVAHNRLSGKIPAELGRFEKLHLEAEGNRINGIPNELCKKNKWMHGGVHLYGCDAILCPKGTYTETGRRESEKVECTPCPNGVDDAPHFGSVGCNGGLPATPDVSAPSAPSTPSAPSAPSTATTSSSSASSSSPKASGGLSGGAKFAVVFVSLSAFLALAVVGRRALARRQRAREIVEEAELERQRSNGVVMDAADAGASNELGESGMLDIPLGTTNGPSSPGVDRCIL